MVKVHGVYLEFVSSMETHKSMVLWTYQNDLGFNLYAALSVCCRVATSEVDQSPRGVSYDKRHIAIKYWSCCSMIFVFIVDYQTREYSISTGSYIQVKLLGELGDFRVQPQVEVFITNFIQLVFPQPVDRFSQNKLYWKAPNDGYLHICVMYKSGNKQLRYQAISNYKSFISYYLMKC